MLCEICNTREARIIFTEIINGQRKEQHLCESCAEKQTRAITGKLGNEISIGSILSGILQNYAKGITSKNANEPVCMRCGMTASELIRGGRVGCSACYNAFSMILDKNLKTSQGSVEHKGKVPVNAQKTEIKPAAQNIKTAADIMNEAADEIARKNARRNVRINAGKNEEHPPVLHDSGPISELIQVSKTQLLEAIRSEDFDEAARLRDLIRKLEGNSEETAKGKVKKTTKPSKEKGKNTTKDIPEDADKETDSKKKAKKPGTARKPKNPKGGQPDE